MRGRKPRSNPGIGARRKSSRGPTLARRRIQTTHFALCLPGLGEEGLRYLAEAREETGLGIVTEAIDVETFDLVERYADCVQIGRATCRIFRYYGAPAVPANRSC